MKHPVIYLETESWPDRNQAEGIVGEKSSCEVRNPAGCLFNEQMPAIPFCDVIPRAADQIFAKVGFPL
jgi:hypothetical protein